MNFLHFHAVFVALPTTSRAFCCADSLCYFCLVLLLIKDRKLMVYSKAGLWSFSFGLQLISDMSMRIYSTASIAENPLLAAVLIQI